MESRDYLANRRPHEDLGKAKQTISGSRLQSYRANKALINCFDMTYLMSNDYVIGSMDAVGPELMKSGVLKRLFGLDLVESIAVTDDEALVLEGQVAATWKQVAPFQSSVIRSPGLNLTLRSWEYGGGILTDPRAVCKITNTQA